MNWIKHDAAYNKYKDLAERTTYLKDIAYKIATDPRIDGYQRALASMVWKFFNERSKGSGIENKKLAESFISQ